MTKNSTTKKIVKTSLYFFSGIALLALIAIISGFFILRGSLPILSGELKSAGLTAPVTIERDTLGIPTITGVNRQDVAQALGFLHGQERFFQIDLMRRAAAGELSELFGSAAIDIDKQRRLHQFRKKSKEILASFSPEEKAIIDAYTRGVNDGINSLSSRPFEYLILGLSPKNWDSEDSILASITLFFELQDDTGAPDLIRGYTKALLPESVYNFFIFNGSAWEAALDGSTRPILPIPPVEDFAYLKVYDKLKEPESSITDVPKLGGSNNWAITGKHTADGKAIIACDMHLKLAEPNIWYRAALVYKDNSGNQVKIVGASLPGTPGMVIGSNGFIAWGWTNSFLDTTDLILIKRDETNSNRYMTVNGPTDFIHETETIYVKGADPVTFPIVKTIWGPVSNDKFFENQMAIQWVAHYKEAYNFKVLNLETSKSAAEALKNLRDVRVPVLNCVVADNEGHIGWMLAGSLPNRKGFDGTVPVFNDDGTKNWEGFADTSNYPVIYNPKDEYVWTANNRVLGTDWKIEINKEGYLNGIRAYKIRNKLHTLENGTPKDMLALQLDTDGEFMQRWQTLLLDVLNNNPETERTKELKHVVESWDKHASINSSGYYWIHRFRELTTQHILARFLHPCFDAWPEFSKVKRDYEEPVWTIVSQKLDYLINPSYGSWQNELMAYVNQMLDKDLIGSKTIANLVWGDKTILNMQHPFTKVIPSLSNILDMPHQALPGDYFMPRLAGPQAGASQRFAVSPGKEEEGIFHSPGGQCGHPLSPHYSDLHEAWVKGEPTPLLSGATIETLVLKP
jgi:penicillin amidase